ncbi:NAD(P)/FAD-dependent oxidoreductase [Antrihabitans sp. YC3-6]|uniref:NAD(P)/FAD-dependent oxidoreductase n=1 Tax=Antrihabitans stalagmiti TaxID=2799499 RepID=A0A934NUS7_9NOCA|nr:NAD(P)/FAD-dependent oxidoreductase [Antrihabitans stalagmiti]MBJ8341934.1 NAD(P)/FAD-dependent oxidoreductase [Antrihabitans stalagmiti]
MTEHFDHIIVGAGLSGIGAAVHLGKGFPERSYVVLESRHTLGGTWDLFRYPGVRSDSDMYTLGYRFKPWTGRKAIADGADIRAYIEEAATENGVLDHIRYNSKVVRAEWSSVDERWTVNIEHTDTGETSQLTCSFLMSTSGYYRYDEGFTPDFAGLSDFKGQIVHPQHWPEDLDFAGKRAVVIGSGATAVTLIPNLAKEAAHVTMLQRSPTYIISQPTTDPIAEQLIKRLPSRYASKAVRGRYLAISIGFYEFCRRRPNEARLLLRKLLERQLPDDVDFDTHFKPKYDPWDQRLCLVPSGDLFKALRKHTVDIVTDHIDTFTETGIRLQSGKEIDADIVVTATGLNLHVFGGVQLAVDGKDIDLPSTMAYKGMMLSGIPNFVFVIGYTNASWTLKADLVCEYTVRLLKHMKKNGKTVMVPRRDPNVGEEPFLDFAANYVLRTVDKFPKQGSEAPWKLKMNFFVDRVNLRSGSIHDDVLEFSGPVS